MTDISRAGKRLDNLDGIPEELLKELNVTKMDDLEEEIIDVLKNGYSGLANIDEIMVGLFRKYSKITKRQFIMNKLYRMAKDKKICSVEGKKGVYETKENKKERENAQSF